MSQKKILVVDNEEVIAEMMQIYLESLGHRVVSAFGGTEAMDSLSEDNEFDLVLLDIMMPQISGWEVLEFMGTKDRLSRIPVIIITAKATETNQQKDKRKTNVVGYILKPFEMEALEREINKIFKDV